MAQATSANHTSDELEKQHDAQQESEPLQPKPDAPLVIIDGSQPKVEEPEAGPSSVNDATLDGVKIPPTDQAESSQPEGFESDGDRMADGFVYVNKDEGAEYKYAHLRDSFYAQIESFLKLQLDKCDYYKSLFKQQNNQTMADKFETFSIGTMKHLELLRKCCQNKEPVPKYSFEQVSFNCVPANVDVKEKEIQLRIKTADLPVANDTDVYVVAEFEFPHPKEEPLTSTVERWFHYLKIEPMNVFFCSNAKSRQLDTVSAIQLMPFTDPDSRSTEYNRPISFFVDKGKSRTLKRKFKPVKLTFYERRGLFRWDKKLGSVQVKIDAINDEITSIMRLPLMDGRRQTETMADVKVRVREPLVNKSVRAHEERILVLS